MNEKPETEFNSPSTTQPELDYPAQVSGLTKIYDQDTQHPTVAVEDVSLNISKGEFVAVVGPSGCGKSTLLLMLAGLVEPTSGEIVIDGKNLDGPRPGEISVVFQEYTLLPWKTTVENIAFPLELAGVGKEERISRAEELVKLVELEGFENSYPDELSGGMKQRVAIARGLIQDPELLLMDEPFGALDEQTRMKMGNEVLDIWNDQEMGIVFVTHDLGEALYLSDRVVVIKDAKLFDVIDVDLPRPRSEDTLEREEYGHLQSELWDMIMD
jgi:NitT/TauT family transport system ATP-binding protein